MFVFTTFQHIEIWSLIPLLNNKLIFLPFFLTHALNNFTDLRRFQFFEEIIVQDGIFDELFGSEKLKKRSIKMLPYKLFTAWYSVLKF